MMRKEVMLSQFSGSYFVLILFDLFLMERKSFKNIGYYPNSSVGHIFAFGDKDFLFGNIMLQTMTYFISLVNHSFSKLSFWCTFMHESCQVKYPYLEMLHVS